MIIVGEPTREEAFVLRHLGKLWQIFSLLQPQRELDHRAAGSCVCDSCGYEYWRHPADPREPSNTML